MTTPSLADRKTILRETAARFTALHEPRPFTDAVREHADEVVAGGIRFNAHEGKDASKPITVGRTNIDWSGGHLKHQEWPTQMSRFFMLAPLMAAFRATGEAVYAEAARDYIADWMDHFDCENIELRGNTCMDIGIRLGTHGFGGWGEALPLFMDQPAWTDAFVERMLASIERQAHILWERGIPSRQWGNHRIFGLDGLLHIALRQPFMADSAAMRRSARKGLNEAQKQFHADGAHIEQTLGYHQHMAETFLYLQRLAGAFPEAGLQPDVGKLLCAAAYLVHTLPAGVNDTAAERLDRAHPEVWAAARRWRAQLTGRDESTWTPEADAVFPDAGQVFCRSSWEPGADFLAFDAGPYSGAHAHLARLGLVFRSGGRLLLADPGTFDYEMSNPFALYGRSTPAHCTANLDGLNQGTDDARLLCSEITPDHALLHGLYTGSYWSGIYYWGFQRGVGQGTYGKHERIVLWIRGEYMLILDGVMAETGRTVETVWQMTPMKAWRQDAGALTWQSQGESPNFHLQMLLAPKDSTLSVYEGQKEPLRGWFCDTYGTPPAPAPQVVFKHPCDSRFHATLAMPLPGNMKPPVTRERAFGTGRCLELAWPDGRVDRLLLSACLATALDETEGVETDSALVWLRLGPDGRPLRHVRLGGSYVRYQGKVISKQ
jgi:hypothetical protein